jgi:hypothetical protein
VEPAALQTGELSHARLEPLEPGLLVGHHLLLRVDPLAQQVG